MAPRVCPAGRMVTFATGSARAQRAVAGLVPGHGVLFLGQQHVGALASAEQDAVAGGVDVVGVEHLPVVTGGADRGLVGQVRQVCSGEPGGAACDHVQVDVGFEALTSAMDRQAGGPLGERGQRNHDLPFEASWSQ